ncbi:MAG: NAD(P)H-dependent oxidoreductase [Promethearchaeota archaeon]
MKVLIVFGSPRHEKSASYHLGQNFAKGLRRAGAQVEEIMLSKQKINHCQGCFTCWTKTPGKCIHQDDMVDNLPKIQEADIVVFATPLYIYNVPGIVKDFLDRSLPLFEPYLIDRNGITSHPQRGIEKERKYFLISVAGFPELSHFDALVGFFKKLFRPNRYLGEILIGGAESMSRDESQSSYKKLYKAIEQAGFEVAKNGIISKETQKAIADESAFTEEEIQRFREIGNKYWDTFKPKDYSQMKIEIPDVEPLKMTDKGMGAFFAGMATLYNPKIIDGLKGVIQFNFENEKYYLFINENECKAYIGSHPKPTTTIITSMDIWTKISTGKVNGEKALIKGLYNVEGDMNLLVKMGSMFSTKRR